MRKMYFAMIPKRGVLEEVALIAGISAGVIYGAKVLLGEEKYNEYKSSIKARVLGETTSTQTVVQGPDTGVGIGDEDLKAKEEESIMERIRRAAKL